VEKTTLGSEWDSSLFSILLRDKLKKVKSVRAFIFVGKLFQDPL
jgi:hypothetical protein